jgi:hypothetical protein
MEAKLFSNCGRRDMRKILTIVFTFLYMVHPIIAQRLLDNSLYGADLAVRTLDAVSTNTLLHAPCKCFTEGDPMAPGAKSLAALSAYQYSFSFGTIALSKLLHARRHTVLSKVIIIADIVSESYVVQHNMRLQAPSPLFSPLLQHSDIKVRSLYH